MSAGASTAYDAVAYPSRCCPQAHPDRLATLATLFGMAPAPVERCRVLELGCGDGRNLLALAFALPGSTFVGVDLAPSAVARAKDEADNVDKTPARRRWTVVDATRPNTTITEHPKLSSNDSSPTFRFRSSEPRSRFECRLDDGAWQACSSPKTYNGLGNGQHVFRVRARDAAGNVDGSPATWTWTIH